MGDRPGKPVDIPMLLALPGLFLSCGVMLWGNAAHDMRITAVGLALLLGCLLVMRRRSGQRAAQDPEFAVRAAQAKSRSRSQARNKLIGLAVSQAVVLPVIVMSASNPAFHLFLVHHRLAVEVGGAALVAALTLAFFMIFKPRQSEG